MRDISITMTEGEWCDLLVDIDAFQGQMMDNDFEYHSLEPGTKALVSLLGEKGVSI